MCHNETPAFDRMQDCAESFHPLYEENKTENAVYYILLMFISGVVYFIFTNILQYNTLNGYTSKLFSLIKAKLPFLKKSAFNQFTSSEDVEEEAKYANELISTNQISREATVIQNLTKQFKSSCIPHNLNLAIRKGECFGLLGGNACGKTSTFKLLTSQLRPTTGNVFIDDLNTGLTINTPKYLALIGYCPQNDALLDCLTGFETLNLFKNIKGNCDVHRLNQIITKFHLQSVINQKVSTYSGGNRRKLSLALALIGNPKLLLLDEPTNGVDHCSRNNVWQLLRNISGTFQVSILLTLHNMQEVEAMCDRIAVMNASKLQCVGSLAELRSKYGKGFTLVLKVESEFTANEQHLSNVKRLIGEIFREESVNLRYENTGVMHYNICSNSMTISHIFENIERIRSECRFEDYIVSNATLEMALIQFMKSN